MKKLLLGVALAAVSMSAFADHDAGCGVGTHLMAGQQGPGPKLLATYTNGILGNQTFGISSGTLGCNGQDAVTEGTKFGFFASNLDQISTEVAVGSGETLGAVAGIYGIVDAADRAEFYALLKSNYSSIFDRADIGSNEVVGRVDALMTRNPRLSRYVNG